MDCIIQVLSSTLILVNGRKSFIEMNLIPLIKEWLKAEGTSEFLDLKVLPNEPWDHKCEVFYKKLGHIPKSHVKITRGRT